MVNIGGGIRLAIIHIIRDVGHFIGGKNIL
jgi:hypothetical protein